MELHAALARVGVRIVKAAGTTSEGDAVVAPIYTLYLRVDEQQGHKWVETITGLLHSAKSNAKKFTVDVSKYFYVQGEDVRYLWRVVLTGDTEFGQGVLASAAMQAAMAFAKEVTSIPLVGRRQYEFNPAKGKFMGGYDYETGQVVVAQALGGAPQ